MQKFIKYFFFYLLSKVFLTFFGIVVFLLWVSSAPRHIPYLDNIVSWKLEKYYPKNEVLIGDHSVFFTKDKKISFSIKGVNVSSNSAIIFTADNLTIDVDIFRFFTHFSVINSIDVKNSIFNYNLGSFPKEFDSNKLQSNYITKYHKAIKQYFKTNLNIDNSKIVIKDGDAKSYWQINKIHGNLDRDNYSIIIDSYLDDNKAELSMIVDNVSSKNSYIKLNFDNIPVSPFFNLCSKEVLFFIHKFNSNQNIIYANGINNISFNDKGGIDQAEISLILSTGNKSENHDIKPQDNLNIDYLKTDIVIKNNLTEILLNKFDASFKHAGFISLKANLNQDLKIKNAFANHIKNLGIEYEVKNFNVVDVYDLWPKFVGEEVRDWVVNNLKSGKIVKGKGKFNFNNEFFTLKKLDDRAIDASLFVEKATLSYLENFPHISQIKGEVKFDGKSLNAKLEEGIIENTKLKNVALTLPYIMDEILIAAFSHGPVQDFKSFIPDNLLLEIGHYNIDLPSIKNHANSNIKLKIPLFDIGSKQILFDINSYFDEIVLSSKMNSFPIKQGKIKFLGNGEVFSITGNASVKNVPFHINYSNKFSENDKPILQAEIVLNNQVIKDINLDDRIKIDNGSALFLINVTEDQISYNSNLTEVDLSFLKIGYHKVKGKKLKLSMKSPFKSGSFNAINDIVLLGEEVDIKGNIEFDPILFILSKADFNIAKIGKSRDIKIDYLLDDKNKKIIVKGKKLDLSASNFQNLFQEKELKSQNISYSVAIDKIDMKNNESLADVKMNLECFADFSCKEINMNAKIAEIYDIKVSLDKNNNDEVIKIVSSNGSAFFRSFGIYKNIKKGDLKIDAKKTIGIADNGRKYLKLDGEINMTDFAIREQSFITKLMLRLISGVGIADIFSGSIKMQSYKSTINYGDGMLNISGRAVGNDVDITTIGTVDTKNNIVDIKGSIIPFVYGLNKLVANIPLVGAIITGGEDEVVSAHYTIKGSIEDPKMNVNPVHLLPISYLKKFFE